MRSHRRRRRVWRSKDRARSCIASQDSLHLLVGQSRCAAKESVLSDRVTGPQQTTDAQYHGLSVALREIIRFEHHGKQGDDFVEPAGPGKHPENVELWHRLEFCDLSRRQSVGVLRGRKRDHRRHHLVSRERQLIGASPTRQLRGMILAARPVRLQREPSLARSWLNPSVTLTLDRARRHKAAFKGDTCQ